MPTDPNTFMTDSLMANCLFHKDFAHTVQMIVRDSLSENGQAMWCATAQSYQIVQLSFQLTKMQDDPVRALK